MNKTVLLSILLKISLCSYKPALGQKLVFASAVAYCSEIEINKWSCEYCKNLQLRETKAFSNPVLDIWGYTGFSESDNAIFVAFRGATDIQNWIANLDAKQVNFPACKGCLIHQGFYNAFQSVEGYMRSEVQKLLAQFRGAKIFVTGHSLGGALATVAALDIKEIFTQVDQFYSFGQPRVGNQMFSQYFSDQIPERFRVIHYGDIVPHLPPQTPLPYAHFAYEIWYDEKMEKYKTCGAEEFKCSKSLLPNKWSTSDNNIKGYVKLSPSSPSLLSY